MIILGSTGSIGMNAMEVARRFGMEIEAIVCKSNTALLNRQIREFGPRFVGVYDQSVIGEIEGDYERLFVGEGEILEMLGLCKSRRVLNAVVGFDGLCFSIRALELDMQLILANKESLVIAGGILRGILGGGLGRKIFPIDSEHFGLYMLINSVGMDYKKLYITASGGALRDMEIGRIKDARLRDVLAHPTWSMGNRITIDSSTMVNKLYEILEAYWLFDTREVDALIERNSIIHAMVEFRDGSVFASLSAADMKLPIAYGLDMARARGEFAIESIGIKDLVKIDLQEIDCDRYPLWRYKELLLYRPHLGIVLNAANEYLQNLFLQEKIPFAYFYRYISECFEYFMDVGVPINMGDIYALRAEVIAYLDCVNK